MWKFEIKSKTGKHLGFANNLDYACEKTERYFKINPKIRYIIIEEVEK